MDVLAVVAFACPLPRAKKNLIIKSVSPEDGGTVFLWTPARNNLNVTCVNVGTASKIKLKKRRKRLKREKEEKKIGYSGFCE